MAEQRRQMHSARVRRQTQQSDAQFWNNQPDPVLIERGQTQAVQLVRDMINSTSTMANATESNTTGASAVPPMVYVDEEGLEEQFLTEDEVSQEVLDVTANRVTTPVGDNNVAPLDPIYTQRSQQKTELDLQPSRGPKEDSIVNALDQFLDDNYEDVLRTSNIQTNFSFSTNNNNVTSKPCLPLSGIVPDGTNRTLEKIHHKKVTNGTSSGGGQAGAIVVTLPRLEPYCGTQFYLVDLETGEVFGFVQQQWRRTGLYCSNQLFAVNELMNKVEQHGRAMHTEMEAKQQMAVVNLQTTLAQFKVPPPLPVIDEPDIYMVHPDAMETNTRRNYVQDWMRAALIYISEYAETQKMRSKKKYRDEDLLVHLRAIFRRVDRIRNHIDQALQQDDAHRRRREMRFLLLPIRFPRPESMGQGNITVWTNWIRKENEIVMNQLDEELVARGDPDDPFNGSANGVFHPLPDNLSLHPPCSNTQKARRHERIQRAFVKIAEKYQWS